MRKGTFRTLPVKLEIGVTDMFSFEVDAKIKACITGETLEGNMRDVSQALNSDEFYQAISHAASELATLLTSDQACHVKVTFGSGKFKQVVELNISHEDKKDEFDVVK